MCSLCVSMSNVRLLLSRVTASINRSPSPTCRAGCTRDLWLLDEGYACTSFQCCDNNRDNLRNASTDFGRQHQGAAAGVEKQAPGRLVDVADCDVFSARIAVQELLHDDLALRSKPPQPCVHPLEKAESIGKHQVPGG